MGFAAAACRPLLGVVPQDELPLLSELELHGLEQPCGVLGSAKVDLGRFGDGHGLESLVGIVVSKVGRGRLRDGGRHARSFQDSISREISSRSIRMRRMSRWPIGTVTRGSVPLAIMSRNVQELTPR